jgi:hypothetical protein
MILPIAREAINRTGYSLFAILGKEALIPRTIQQSPKASNNAFLYFSFIPVPRKEPNTPPISIVAVFTIVPNIYLKQI